MRYLITPLLLCLFSAVACSSANFEQTELSSTRIEAETETSQVTPSPSLDHNDATLQANQTQNAAFFATSSVRQTATSAAKATQFALTSTLTPTPTLFEYFQTPPASTEFFRLKQLTQMDIKFALEEGEWAVKQSLEDWENFPSRYSSYDFSQYLYTLERETHLRYPEYPNSEELLWRIAYGEAIFLDEQGNLGGFVKLVESAINDKMDLLPSLDVLLKTYKFQVSTSFRIENLFGDGIPATVIEVETDRFTSALFVARPQVGYYRWIPIWENWAGKGQTNYVFSAEDMNGNGLQEIMILVNSFGLGSPGSCSRGLELFEWNSGEERFVNLASNVGYVSMSYASGECERPWEFIQAPNDDSKMIVSYKRLYNESDSDCQLYEEWKRYIWNGLAYEWDQSGIVPYEGVHIDLCAIGWANVAGVVSDQAIQILAFALTNWPNAVNETWGPASEDYFRYKLGTWYAIRGQPGLAKPLLLSVQDNPKSPQYSFASKVAEIYLTNFESGSVPQLCEIMHPILLEEFSTIPNDGFRLIAEEMMEKWGFIVVPPWKSPNVYDFCEPEMPDVRLPPNTPYIDDSPLAKQREAIEEAERTLFQNQDYSVARTLLQNLLASEIIEHQSTDEPEKIRPYLQYLLRLTYEFSGMEREAVETYWRLWNDYPDNPYTLIIRRKLVLVP